MADIVLDANVIVGYLDVNDALHARSVAVFDQLESTGNTPLMLDFLIAEAVSVVCRRFQQRKSNPPDFGAIIAKVLNLLEHGDIDFVSRDGEGRFRLVLDAVEASHGALNFHDATLLVLQQDGTIGPVATFDDTLARYPGFTTWS